jgi:hypothetical protein
MRKGQEKVRVQIKSRDKKSFQVKKIAPGMTRGNEAEPIYY